MLRVSTSFAGLLLAGAVAMATGSARAATLWVGGTVGSENDYGTASNWNPASVPNLGETAEFNNGTTWTTISETGGRNVDAFQFDAGAPSYTINLDPGGVAFAFWGAGIVNNSGVTQTINVLSQGMALENGASLGDGNVIVNLTGSAQLDFDGTSTGGLATVNLNTSRGILITGASHSLSLGALGGSSGVIQFSGANQSLTIGGNNLSTTFSGQITQGGGTGSVTKTGTGTLTLAGSNSYSLGTTISGGTLTAANAVALGTGNVTLGNAHLRAAVDFTVPGSTFTFQDGSVSTVSAATGTTLSITPTTLFFPYNAAGTVHFGAAGDTGTVLLGATSVTAANLSNSYSIDAGTLKFAHDLFSAFANSPSVTVASGATLDLNGTSSGARALSGGGTITNSASGTTSNFVVFGTNADSTFSGSLKDGAGIVSLTKAQSHLLTLTGANTYSGDTTITGGTLRGGAADAFSANSAVTVNGGTTLDLGGFDQEIGSLSGTGVVTNSGAGLATLTTNGNGDSTTFSGQIKDSGTGEVALVKAGGGVLTLSGTDTYSGGTTIKGGVLVAGAMSALGSNTVTFGGDSTLRIGFDGTLANRILGSPGVSPTIGFGGHVAVLGSGTFEYDGGSGTTLHFGETGGSGTLTLIPGAVTSDPDGAWSLDDGMLVLGNASASSLLGGLSAANLAAHTILDLGGNDFELASPTGSGEVRNYGGGPVTLSLSGTSTFAGSIESIASDIAVNKIGPGTITLTGTNTYSQGTTISGGTLALSGSGSIAESSGVSLASGGTFDISQTTAGASIKSLSSSGGGNVALGSETLTITNASGTFDGTIADGGLGGGTGGGLTLSGGALTLSGANSYTGATSLTGSAALFAGAANVFSAASATSISGAMLDLGGFTQTIDHVSLSGNGLLSDGNLTGAVTSSFGTVAGIGGGASVETTGAGVTTFIGNSFTGGLTLNGGDALLSGGSALSDTGAVHVQAGTLEVANDETIGTLDGVGGKVEIEAGQTLTVNQAATGSFGGAMVTLDAAGRLVKEGAGTLTLTGSNAPGAQFTGTAIIDAGRLQVDGTFGDTAGNAAVVTVSSGGTLGGNGTIAGSVNGLGGTISAGASPGVLAVAGNLDLDAATTSLFEMGSPNVIGNGTPAANNDFITVGGNLDLDGTLKLRAADGTGQITAGYYTLYQVGGAVTHTGDPANGFATIDAGAFSGSTDIYETTAGGGATRVNALVGGAAAQPVQFWDGADMLGNNVTDGGAGTWNAANTNWTNLGGAINDFWRSGVGVFQGAAGTVTVAGPLDFQGLQFKTDGYLVTGSSLNMAGDSSPGGNADASFITVDGGVTATIASNLTGRGLDKIVGGGTLILTGANSYSGQTRVSIGTLEVGNASALGNGGNALRVDTSGVLDLGGFTLAQGSVNLSDSGAIRNGTLQAAAFSQSGGTMSATVSTPVYTLTDGTMSGTVNATAYDQSGGEMSGMANAGTYSLAGGTVSGTATATTLFDMQDGTVTGRLAGGARLVKSGAGTVTLTGADSYTGGTAVDAGTLVGNAASIRGDIANDALVVFNQPGDATFAGNIGGTGDMVKGGLGALTLAGASTLDWEVLAGGLVSAADRFSGNVEIGSGASFTFDQASDATYAGSISGDGTFFKQGAGRATLSGDSSAFTGATTVAAGTLSVNGTLGGTLSVLSGGRLQGGGTVGTTTVASGATVAPGNSIGTLTVAGDISFAAGSTYEVEVQPGGAKSDLLHATGKAFLNGGSVLHVGETGTYRPIATYTILTADGGVAGRFGGVSSTFAFLDPTLTYNPNNVFLQLVRNNVDFGSIGKTRNQRDTGNGVGSLGIANPLWNAVAVLSEDEARAAFDSLSGEVHASAKTMLLDDSRFVRDAATDRVRAAFEGAGAASVPVMAYGEGGFAPAPADTDRLAVWMRGFGSWGEWGSDGNAAALDRSIGGVFVGADGLVTENLRLGLVAGYSHSNFDVDGRASSGTSEDYHLGFYGGSQWGALGLRFGAAYSWHDIETARSVAFPGFSDRLSADYDAATAQAFGELGYRIDTSRASFEPFAGLAYVNLHTDGFAERGGAAALTGAGADTDATFTTLGIRASTDFLLGGTSVKARGMLGWRHAFGDTTPLSSVSFAGGNAFSVAGVPIARDAAVIEAGLDFTLTERATLGLSYSGQIAGGGTQDHGFKADLRVKF